METYPIKEKSCENCRYYLAYYVKRGIRYVNTYNGHCTNRNHTDKRKKHKLELCGFWEDIAIKKEERKRSVKEAIICISERLDEIATLLKDDF